MHFAECDVSAFSFRAAVPPRAGKGEFLILSLSRFQRVRFSLADVNQSAGRSNDESREAAAEAATVSVLVDL